MLKDRLATIEKFIDILYTGVDRYEKTTTTFCKMGSYADGCDAVSYGSLLEALQKADLWPRPKCEDIRISLNQIALAVNELEIYSFNGHVKCFGTDEMKKCVIGVMLSIESPVLDSHRQHFQIQNEG
jgi:hypothetical protein